MDYIHKFENPEEFFRVRETPLTEFKTWERDHEWYLKDPKFCGATETEIRAWQYSYTPGISAIMDMPEITAQTFQAQTCRSWDTDEGDDGDMERYLTELPHMIRRKKRLGHGQRAVCRILVNIGEHCGIHAADMLYKTYAAGRLADQIEATGTRAEIVIISGSEGAIDIKRHDDDTIILGIIVKRPEDPLNLAAVAAMCTPWMLRYWILGWMDGRYKTTTGHGRPMRANNPAMISAFGITDDDILIDREDCLSIDKAREKVLQYDTTRIAA